MVDEMFDSRKNTGGCGCGPDAVAYLYGELVGEERSAFEDHLSDCESCTDDLAAFSVIRLSLAEAAAPEASPNGGLAAESARPGFFETIRSAFLGSSPGTRALAGAFAAAVLIVTGYFVLGLITHSPDTGNVAEKGAAQGSENRSADNPEPPGIVTNDAPEISSGVTTDEQASGTDKSTGAPVKSDISDRAAKSARTRGTVHNPRRTSTGRIPPNQLANNDEPPRLSEAAAEDLEDDSLRLTDLFAEVGKED